MRQLNSLPPGHPLWSLLTRLDQGASISVDLCILLLGLPGAAQGCLVLSSSDPPATADTPGWPPNTCDHRVLGPPCAASRQRRSTEQPLRTM